MDVCSDIAAVRTRVRDWKAQGLRVGFVPTMGNLHAGHLALVDEALRHADRVLVSIYVNPLQFNQEDDFSAYPRTLEADVEQLRTAGAQALFTPDDDIIYPHGQQASCKVSVPGLSEVLEGEHRPGHFTGVTTVVAKLFNIVQPALAVFGEKDFQQLMLIRQMVRDLDMPIEIRAVATCREADGLAMSSRNGRLSPAQREQAPALYRELRRLADLVTNGERDYTELERQGLQRLREAGFEPEYLTLRRSSDLQPPAPDDRELVILAAAWLGAVRLIDNLPLGPNLNP